MKYQISYSDGSPSETVDTITEAQAKVRAKAGAFRAVAA